MLKTKTAPEYVTFVESLILIEADNIDTYFADKITQNKTIAILQEEMYMKRAEAILEVLNPVLWLCEVFLLISCFIFCRRKDPGLFICSRPAKRTIWIRFTRLLSKFLVDLNSWHHVSVPNIVQRDRPCCPAQNPLPALPILLKY